MSLKNDLKIQAKDVIQMLRKRKAQSTLEYIIIFTAIVAAILVVANALKPKITNMIGHASDEAVEAVEEIDFGKKGSTGGGTGQ